MSDLFVFSEILIPIIAVLIISILVTILSSRNLGGFLACCSLTIGVLVWLEYFSDGFLVFSALFIALSIYIGVSGVASNGE